MKETVEITGVKTYWNPQKNELYSGPVHKSVHVQVPLKLVLLKLYLIIASIGAGVCLFSATVVGETSNNDKVVCILATLGVVFLVTLYLWFTYYIKIDALAEPYAETWHSELQEESTRLSTEATKWRSEHPLEEQCRKALENNPNEIAQLIRMLQEGIHDNT